MLLLNAYKPFVASWVAIVLFKVGAVLHYSTITVLGAQVLPIWVVGAGNAVAAGLQLALDIPAGLLVQRYGAARMLGLSTCALLVAAGVWFFGVTPQTYVVSLLASALGWLFFSPAHSAYILANAPASHVGRLSAARRIMEGVGGLIPTALLPLYVTLPSKTIGLLMLYPLLGSLVALYIVGLHERGKKRVLPARSPRVSLITRVTHALRTTGIAGGVMMGWTFALSAFYGGLWLVVPLLVARGNPVLSIALVGIELSSIMIGGVAGKLADSKARRRVFLPSALIGALAALLVGHVGSWWFVGAVLVLSFADEFVTDTLWTFIHGRTQGKHIEGVVSGAVTFFDDLGYMVGPALAGFLFAFGSATVFTALALPIVAMFLIGSVLFSAKHAR